MKRTASSHDGIKFSKRKQTRSNVVSVSEFRNLMQTEESLQAQCEELLSYYPHLVAIRIPDRVWKLLAGPDKWQRAARAAVSRWLGGMPDLIILARGRPFNACLAVELKVKGRKLRTNQRKWADVITVHRVERFEDFNELLDQFVAEKSV